MNNTDDDPIYLMKSISYNLKRIADAMESQSTDKKPTVMSETFEFKDQPRSTVYEKIRATKDQNNSQKLKAFLDNLGKESQ